MTKDLDSLLPKNEFSEPDFYRVRDRIEKSRNLARTYKALCWLKHNHNIGKVSAKEVSNLTGIGYSYQYQLLQELENLKLIHRLGKKAVWLFHEIDEELLTKAIETIKERI